MTAGIDRQNPWPGLQSFEERDSAFFFGRDAEIDELFRTVKRETATLLYGLSGLGKTSLLKAGLLPVLRAQGFLPIEVRLDYGRSGPRVLVQQLFEAVKSTTARERIDAEAPRPDDTLWEYFHRVPFWDQRNNLVTPVLVVDQFEEVFTLGEGHDAVEPLLIELADLVENRIPETLRRSGAPLPPSYDRPKMKVLVAMREDFLPNADELMRLTPSLVQNRFRLHQLRVDQALRAVLEPGREVITESVAAQVVAFVAGGRAKDRVEPSLLSLVCRELNQRRREEGLAQISTELLEGERDQVVSDFYERTTRDVGPLLQHFVEDRLLTSDGFRTTVAIQDALGTPGVTREGIDRLVDVRLLRLEERLGLRHVEIVHDVLARVAKESRDHRHELVARRRRRRRQVSISVAVALLALLVTAAWSFWSWQQRQTRDALNRKNAELYTELGRRESLDGDPGRALTYLAAAHDAAGGNVTTEFLLKRAAQAFHKLEVKTLKWPNPQNPPLLARLSDDGHTALAVLSDGVVDLWEDGELRTESESGFRLNTNPCVEAGVVTTVRGGQAAVVVSRGDIVRRTPGHLLDVSVDCRRMLIELDGRLSIIEVATGQVVASPTGGRGVYRLSPDGEVLVHLVETRHAGPQLGRFPAIATVQVARAPEWKFAQLTRTDGCPRVTGQWPEAEWRRGSSLFTADSRGFLLRDALLDLTTGKCRDDGVLSCSASFLREECSFGPAAAPLAAGVLSQDRRGEQVVSLSEARIVELRTAAAPVWSHQVGADASEVGFVDDQTVLVKGRDWLETWGLDGQRLARVEPGEILSLDLRREVLLVEITRHVLAFTPRTLEQVARVVYRLGDPLDAQLSGTRPLVLRTSADGASLQTLQGAVVASVRGDAPVMTGAIARTGERAVACSARSCVVFGADQPEVRFEGADGVLSASGRFAVLRAEDGTRVCEIATQTCTLMSGVSFAREAMMRVEEPLAAFRAARPGMEVAGMDQRGDVLLTRARDAELLRAGGDVACRWAERAQFQVEDEGDAVWRLTVDGLVRLDAKTCSAVAASPRAFRAVRGFDVARERALVASSQGVFLLRPSRADFRAVLPIKGVLEASAFDEHSTFGFWREQGSELGTVAVVDGAGPPRLTLQARAVARRFVSGRRLAYFDAAGLLVLQDLAGNKVVVDAATDPLSTVLFDDGKQLLTRLSDSSGSYLALFKVGDALRLDRVQVFPKEAVLASSSYRAPLIRSGGAWWVGGHSLRDEVFSFWKDAWEEEGCGREEDFQLPVDQFSTATPLDATEAELVFLAEDGRHFARLSKLTFETGSACDRARAYWFGGVVPVKGNSPRVVGSFWHDESGTLQRGGEQAPLAWSPSRRFELVEREPPAWAAPSALTWLLTGGRRLPIELRDDSGRLLERFGVDGSFQLVGALIRYADDDGVVGGLEFEVENRLNEEELADLTEATGLHVTDERPGVLQR